MKRKILVVLMSSLLLFGVTACRNNQENADDTDNQQSSYDSNASILPENSHNTDTVPETIEAPVNNTDNETNENEINDNEINENAKMEIVLCTSDGTGTYAITETDRISFIYDILSGLTYETAEDVSLNDSINIYFYDVNDNMTQAFHIDKNYLKLDGLPDTYVITNTDFDYDEFKRDVYELIYAVTGAERIP